MRKLKNKLKIMHVILSKGFAGSEKYVVDLACHQNENNQVHVIILKQNKELKNSLEKKLNIYQIGSFLKKYNIQKIINKIKPQIVHTHLGEAAKIVQKSKEYKTIATMHMNYKHKDYKNSDAIIVSNNTQYKEIRKKYYGKLFKSYLWVKLPKLEINKTKLRKNLNIPKKNFIFGSIGRFHPQKGFDILIKCFEEMNLENCTLILIGNGHEKYKFLETKNNNFKIIGQIKNVSNYYNLFDVGLFFSRWETFGYSLIEAMQYKLPIISSTHIGNKDWLNKFKISKVNINNQKQLIALIKKLYKLKPTKKNYDLKMFDYNKNCDAITSIYRELLVK